LTLISVVMCTFDREVMARRTIASVYGQRLPGGLSLELIVVDNTPDGNARTWVEGLSGLEPRPRYVHETRAGISHARNAGVAAASGEFLAFIDDDETAEPDWLENLHRALLIHGADMGTGPVLPVFEDKPALGWDPTPFFFGKREAMATGGQLQAARTGNIMFRVATCFDGTPPFDPRLGRSGGEDTDFTHGLYRKGRKIIWVADAVVHEFWPQAKASLPAFLRRKLVTARNTTHVRITRDPRPMPAFLAIVPKALAQLVIFSPLAAVSYPFSRQFYARCAMQVMSALGKLTFWQRAGYYGRSGGQT
jgi:succinoglycan biosynthesis protein ExoM